MGSAPLLLHPQGAQKVLFGEGVDGLGWLRGSHHPADVLAGKKIEVRLRTSELNGLRVHWPTTHL